MKRFLLAASILFSCNIHAAIYVNKASDGSIEYSDTPTQQSKKIEIPTASSITVPKTITEAPLPAQQAVSKSETDQDENNPTSNSTTYKKFAIVSPKNEAAIQNQPTIPVEMLVEPNMLPGDKIQLMLDNTPVGTPTSTSYQEIGLIERGTHSLYAVIQNNKDQVIKKSSTVTIYVHRNSTITSPRSK